MATKYRGTAEEQLALDTFIKLSRASESIDTRLLRHGTLEELTLTQFAVLEALLHLGSLTQRDIGAKLLKSGGNITLVIDNLEKHGYVKRRRCESDRRLIYVELTTSGRALIDRVFPRHLNAIVHEISVLSPDEQATLGTLLRKLGRGHADSPDCLDDECLTWQI